MGRKKEERIELLFMECGGGELSDAFCAQLEDQLRQAVRDQKLAPKSQPQKSGFIATFISKWKHPPQ